MSLSIHTLLADIVPLIRMPATQRGVFTYRVSAAFTPRIARGAFVRIPFRQQRVWGICVASPSPARGTIRGLRDILGLEESWLLTPDEVSTIERLASQYRISVSTAAYLLVPSPPRNAGAKKSHASYNEVPGCTITIPDEQTGVAVQKEIIGDTIIVYQNHGQRLAAIRELAQRCISHGASVLVVTPHRVWLNPLSRMLGDLPLVVMDTGARGVHASWDAVTAARKPGVVILGTRAAAWVAPPSLGAIIIDEAHSDDHKQWDMQPKYDARAITAVVARARGIPRFLLSPAPRVEDWVRSAQHIQFPEGGHRMGRSSQTVTPPYTTSFDVSLIRLDHFWRSGGRGLLTDDLLDGVRETIATGRIALLLHNRRGRMGRLVCADCGAVVSCAACAQPVAEFAEGLRCRVCEEPAPLIITCPKCQSALLRGRSIGTAGIVDLLQKVFPDIPIARVDRDTPAAPPPGAQIIVATERYTTSIAPADQRDIGLVAVLHAERYVRGDDYRMNERLLAALRDIAVWARTWRAKMIVQTADPAHPAIVALTGDLAPFMDAEQREREALHYPPATRLIRFDTIDAAAAQNAAAFKDLLKRDPHGTVVDIAGPFSYGFVRGCEITSVLVHLRPDATDAAIASLVASVPPSWSVDVDPVALHA